MEEQRIFVLVFKFGLSAKNLKLLPPFPARSCRVACSAKSIREALEKLELTIVDYEGETFVGDKDEFLNSGDLRSGDLRVDVSENPPKWYYANGFHKEGDFKDRDWAWKDMWVYHNHVAYGDGHGYDGNWFLEEVQTEFKQNN
ncbi:hypothetical protein L6259_00710 [Candidatus Parcubacteria bacterium]|nr:hypothetical protein [Patescibacteria group bacterium]MCG2693793.1 hypothetical protein [Candidatus Parcubacteria bacterium]